MSEDTYECEECDAFYHTILPAWMLPPTCWKCGARHPWKRVPKTPVDDRGRA